MNWSGEKQVRVKETAKTTLSHRYLKEPKGQKRRARSKRRRGRSKEKKKPKDKRENTCERAPGGELPGRKQASERTPDRRQEQRIRFPIKKGKNQRKF